MMGQMRCSAAMGVLLLGLLLPNGRARAAASAWDTQLHGAARLVTATEATGSGTHLDIGIQLRLTPGWHTYWRAPGDAGIAPTIDWKGSDNIADAALAWPAPHRLPALGGLETQGYGDSLLLPVTITLAHPGEALHLHAEVDYASCNEVCIPYHASLGLVLPTGLARPGPEAPLIAAAEAQVPGDLDMAGLKLISVAVSPSRIGTILSVRLTSHGLPLNDPDLFVEGLGDGAAGRPEIELAEGGRLATLTVPLRSVSAGAVAGTKLHLTMVDGRRSAETDITPLLGILPSLQAETGRAAVIGIALLGGLILNLMPCVLPVLSLKLLALVGYAGGERRAARLGLLASAVGILVSFAVLAAVLIVLKMAGSSIGWGIQFQQPWFLAGMALATTLFAASLWDWLPIALPGGMASAVGSLRGRRQLSDAFLLGGFTTLLAASCSAPFVGTAIGFALARGPLDIGLVFGALGLGMAAPFLAIAAVPALVAWAPRPGRWMAWLRVLLGLVLLGTAVWLLNVLTFEAGDSAALVAGTGLGMLLVVLAWRHHRPARRRIATIVAAGLAAFAVLFPALHGQAVPADTRVANVTSGPWRPFDEAAIPGIVANKQVVFVDVTAAWCLTCKVNEMTVLNRAPVLDQLRSANVVTMRADWTRPDSAITAYLQRFGRYGVPFNVVYGPGAPNGIALPELLTPQAVMDAFRQAASLARAQTAQSTPK